MNGIQPLFADQDPKRELRLVIDYSARPDAAGLAAFDVCILDPAAKVDLGPCQARGTTCLAYVSLVEAAPGSVMEARSVAGGFALKQRNPEWGGRLLDVGQKAWSQALDAEIESILRKGYDGFFLDTVDSLERLKQLRPERAAADRTAVLDWIRRLHEAHPGKQLVMNRGFDLLEDLEGRLDGVLIEGVCYGKDARTGAYAPLPDEALAWTAERVKRCQALGLRVFGVEYVDPKKPEQVEDAVRRLRALGCMPLVTTPDLRGVVLGPMSGRPGGGTDRLGISAAWRWRILPLDTGWQTIHRSEKREHVTLSSGQSGRVGPPLPEGVDGCPPLSNSASPTYVG
ncbi:MAG: endo alpha-1,4 polygalactosaminidase [Verrucomicrobiales bacterium]|nr:endo alpha-1,4 polygalactosaminidase [Verrucomicrobiales bacterium]